MTALKEWAKANSGLIYFLIVQAIGIGTAVFSMTVYMTNLEARLHILETRGSPHLGTIDNRLTVLESQTRANKESIERIVDVMTKRLNINP